MLVKNTDICQFITATTMLHCQRYN